MNCKIDTTPDFARDLKQLAKRYPSMKDDYRDFLDAVRNSAKMVLALPVLYHSPRQAYSLWWNG